MVKESEEKLESLLKERNGGVKGDEVGENERELEGRIKIMEGMMEKKEREKRKRNIVIKDLEVKEGNRREQVESVMEKIGVKVKIEDVSKI